MLTIEGFWFNPIEDLGCDLPPGWLRKLQWQLLGNFKKKMGSESSLIYCSASKIVKFVKKNMLKKAKQNPFQKGRHPNFFRKPKEASPLGFKILQMVSICLHPFFVSDVFYQNQFKNFALRICKLALCWHGCHRAASSLRCRWRSSCWGMTMSSNPWSMCMPTLLWQTSGRWKRGPKGPSDCEADPPRAHLLETQQSAAKLPDRLGRPYQPKFWDLFWMEPDQKQDPGKKKSIQEFPSVVLKMELRCNFQVRYFQLPQVCARCAMPAQCPRSWPWFHRPGPPSSHWAPGFSSGKSQKMVFLRQDGLLKVILTICRRTNHKLLEWIWLAQMDKEFRTLLCSDFLGCWNRTDICIYDCCIGSNHLKTAMILHPRPWWVYSRWSNRVNHQLFQGMPFKPSQWISTAACSRRWNHRKFPLIFILSRFSLFFFKLGCFKKMGVAHWLCRKTFEREPDFPWLLWICWNKLTKLHMVPWLRHLETSWKHDRTAARMVGADVLHRCVFLLLAPWPSQTCQPVVADCHFEVAPVEVQVVAIS